MTIDEINPQQFGRALEAVLDDKDGIRRVHIAMNRWRELSSQFTTLLTVYISSSGVIELEPELRATVAFACGIQLGYALREAQEKK